jgi:hypothetical protein
MMTRDRKDGTNVKDALSIETSSLKVLEAFGLAE